MSSCNNTSVTEHKARIRSVYNVRIRNRINLVHSDNLRVTSQPYLVTTADNIQVSNPSVIPDAKLLYTDHYVEVSDLYIIFYGALARIDYAETDTHALAHSVTKEEAINGPFEKRRKEGD